MATNPDGTVDERMKTLLDLDAQRKSNPVTGRKADEAMMALCEAINDKGVSAAKKTSAVAKIKGLTLRPYWSYCREHLTGIGLEF